MNIREKAGKIYWRLNMTYQTEDERKGQRRRGMEIVGIVEERYPNGARDTRSVFRYSGLLTWLKNNRSEQERRAPEGSQT